MNRCPVCNEVCSWADEKFGGHCTPRRGPQQRRGKDAIVEGYHPGIGHVSGAYDLQKKVDAAQREGKVVTRAVDIPDPGERPRVNTGKPTAWEKTLREIDRGLLDGL